MNIKNIFFRDTNIKDTNVKDTNVKDTNVKDVKDVNVAALLEENRKLKDLIAFLEYEHRKIYDVINSTLGK